jgi:hypothetical protein
LSSGWTTSTELSFVARRLDLRQELAERRLLALIALRDQPRGEERQDDHDDDREGGALEEPAHGRTHAGCVEVVRLDKSIKATSGSKAIRKPVWNGFLCIS